MGTVQKPERLWQAVLGDLQLQVTRPSYETWLKGTVGLACSDSEFVVGVPTAFVAEMLDQRMYSLISQALGKVVPDGVDVRFQVTRPDPLAVDTAGHVPNAQPAANPGAGGPETTTGETTGLAFDPTADPLTPPARLDGAHLQRPGGIAVNPRYTFESFIVGKSNELAHAAALAVSERPGITYNPLFIYSGVGLGKTHLLHAIGHRVMAAGLSLIYATTEEFTNDYIKAIREGKTEQFRGRYRSADVLLLDDIQFIIGKEQTQEGFFHTFNTLHMAARQIVITSDRPATALTLLEDRVRSRLAGGLTVDIQPPDIETRIAILRAKADLNGQRLPSEILQFLAERIHTNIRDLEGCLTRLAAYAQLTATEITLDVVKNAIADLLHPTRTRRLSEDAILTTICTYFSTDKHTLVGRRRDKQTALTRQIAMYMLRQEANLPLTAIGRILGGRDHTTVLHGCQRITSQLPVDAHLRRDVINIREALTAN